MKKTSKALICMGIVASMLTPALGASAATVSQPQLAIYQGTLPVSGLGSLSAGTEATLKKQLVNNTDSPKRMALIAAEYDNGRIIQTRTSDITVPANSTVFATVKITPTNPANIKVFTWELPSATPNDALPYNTLSSVKIGNYSTYVEGASKTVYVNTTDDISSAQVSDVKVSPNATYTVAQGNSAITVTAQDGTTEVYAVKTGGFTKLDFDSDTVGSVPTTTTGETTISPDSSSTRKVIVATDPDDANNKVLKVWDNYSAASAAACEYRYDLAEPVSYPYVVSTKVRYDRENTYSANADNINYNWFRLRNRENNVDTNIYHFGAEETGDGEYLLKMPYEAGTSTESTVDAAQGGIGQWHQVDMVCKSAADIKVYFDGRLVRSAGAETVSDVALTRIYFITGHARKNTTYLDDIVIRPMEKASLTEAVFNVPSLMVDGTVYVQADNLSGVTLDASKSTYTGTDIDVVNSAVVVTSESGTATYPIVLKTAANFFADDYEGVVWTGEKQNAVYVGSGDINSNKVYYDRQNRSAGDDVYMMTVSENGNKVLKMNAGVGTATGNRFGLNITNIPSSSSYVIDYDVKYSIPAGTTFNNVDKSGEGVTPVAFSINGRNTNSKDLVGFRPANYNSTTETFNASRQTSSNTGNNVTSSWANISGTSIAMNTWYKVKIVVKAGKATYYLDDVAIASDVSVSSDALNRISIWSSTNRKATVYLDNLKVLDLTE
ncbi:MAG: hypothetical protein IJT23_08060 [Clostridia bacterium]|nr:hypothetical protein [Clostridia bacterium]